MENTIKSVPELALQYGTITPEQLRQVSTLLQRKAAAGEPVDPSDLMVEQHFATHYQVGLLKLIREYQIVKKKGEAFGKIAVEKGWATRQDIDQALDLQKKEFKKAKLRRLIGDILVESRVITARQKEDILKEQRFMEEQAERLNPPDGAAELSDYESRFLKTKVLDQEFAAAVVEKRMATATQVRRAQAVQENAFETDKSIRLLGDIMVELNHLSQDQMDDILEEQNRLEKPAVESSTRPIRIEVSADRMAARVVLQDDPEQVQPHHILTTLKQEGICHGVYPTRLFAGFLDMGRTSFPVARQDPSVERAAETRILLHFKNNGIDKDIKEMGSALVEQKPGAPPLVKKDVFGKNTQTNGSVSLLNCGTGTRRSRDQNKVFAAKTGFPSQSIEGRFFIHPDINVLEDADLRYGALEKYANLKVLGIVTGAYPIFCGHLQAREIRGAQVTAIGSVTADLGISEAQIDSQGSIRARYIHSSTLYAFGDVYVDAEIIDSKIYCSGKIMAPGCTALSSDLYAKKGVDLGAAGNDRTRPCLIGAGTEHHVLSLLEKLDEKIIQARQPLDALIEKKEEQENLSARVFQKMVELKLFHDRAKKKKEALAHDFKTRKNSYKKEKLKNIATLLSNFQNRMTASVERLKKFNHKKKQFDKKKNSFEEQIKKIQPRIDASVKQFEHDKAAMLEWARKKESSPQIQIAHTVFSGTLLKGTFSSLQIKETLQNAAFTEKQVSDNTFELCPPS